MKTVIFILLICLPSIVFSMSVSGSFSYSVVTIAESDGTITIAWDAYDTPENIIGFRVYLSNSQYGFEIEPENAVCTALANETSCAGIDVECGQWITVTAYSETQESEIANPIQYNCED